MPGTLHWEGADSSCLRGLKAKAALALKGLNCRVMSCPSHCLSASLHFIIFYSLPCFFLHSHSQGMGSPWGEALVPQAGGEVCSKE